MKMCHFWAQNGLFIINHYYFRLPIDPFHCVKFKKNSYSESRVMKMPHFWAQNGSKKLIITFSYTYQPLSSCKKILKFLKPIQIYEDVPFLGQKDPNLSWTKFVGTNHYYYFHLPIGTFHWAKFKKNSYHRSRVMRMHHFGPKMVHLAQTKTFLENY